MSQIGNFKKKEKSVAIFFLSDRFGRKNGNPNISGGFNSTLSEILLILDKAKKNLKLLSFELFDKNVFTSASNKVNTILFVIKENAFI